MNLIISGRPSHTANITLGMENVKLYSSFLNLIFLQVTNSWAHLYDANLVPNMIAIVFVSPKPRYRYLIADKPLRKYVLGLSMALYAEFEREQYVGSRFIWYGH